MKKVIKWIFIILLVGVFAFDMYGFWKYKLSGTPYVIAGDDSSGDSSDSVDGENSSEEVENTEPEPEYQELVSTDFSNGEKLFITHITKSEEDEEKYDLKGLVYEEYEITKDEYTSLKNGKSTVEIMGSIYSKNTFKNSKLALKSEDENAGNFYVMYESATKKYVLKDADTDENIYKATEKYVKTTVDGSLSFGTKVGAKTTKQTVAQVYEDYAKVDVPESSLNLEYATLTFDKSGAIKSITQIRYQ